MNRLFGRGWFEGDLHPAEEDLLFYVDGEVSGERRAEIRTHLEACWTCRANCQKIQHAISTIVDYLNDGFLPAVERPPMAWQTFGSKMRRVGAEAVRRPWSSRWQDLLIGCFVRCRLSVRWTVTLLATLFLVFIFAPGEKVSPVSASQLIQKAAQAQEQRLERVTHPIVYQRLRVRCEGPVPSDNSTFEWETWNDSATDHFRQRIKNAEGNQLVDTRSHGRAAESEAVPNEAPREKDELHPPAVRDVQAYPLLQQLDQILRANRMNQRSPLSPLGYGLWRKSIHCQSEEIREINLAGGEPALALVTAASAPFRVNSIMRSELVIRTEDWHPVAQRLQVQGEYGVRGFDLTETGFEVLASNALPHSIFEDRPVLDRTSGQPIRSVQPQVLSPTTDELIASEIEALFALHRVRACIGRPITVVRSAFGRIEVKGVVETQARKKELCSVLKGIPWITVRVQTIDEIPFEPSKNSNVDHEQRTEATATSEQNGGASFRGEKLFIQDLLEEYFSAGQEETAAKSISQKIAWLSNNAVSRSEAALEQAWALRRLAELNCAIRHEELRFSSRHLLELMMRDHLGNLGAETNQLRTLLTPVLSGLLTRSNKSSPKERTGELASLINPDWPGACLNLFSAVDRSVRLTLSLFADTRLPVGSRDQAMTDLLAAFENLQAEFQRFQVQVALAFPERAGLQTAVAE